MNKKLTLILILSQFCFAFNANNYESFVVLPKNKEGGTFYLSKDSLNKKGYISILNPINIKKINGKLVYKRITEKKSGAIVKYYEFVTAYGVSGYIKHSMVRSLAKLSRKSNVDLIDEDYNQIVTPINPYSKINIFNFDNQKKPYTNFTRSYPLFVVSNGKVIYKTLDDESERPYIKVKYFEKQSAEIYKIKYGLISSPFENNDYELHKTKMSTDKVIELKQNYTMSEKIVETFKSFINKKDKTNFVKGLGKQCNQELNLTFTVGLDASLPLNITFSAGAQGELNYIFPRNYRYTSNVYIDNSINKKIKISKSIVCKENTLTDKSAQSMIFIGNDIGINNLHIYQDEILKKVESYFEVPNVAGMNRKREKMIKMKDTLKRDGKDVFSAYYILNKYIMNEVFQGIEVNDEYKLRLKNFIKEQIIQYN